MYLHSYQAIKLDETGEKKMIAIQTKYVGPTNNKGSRVIAKANGNRLTIPFNHASKNPHADAALALCQKLGWKGTLIEGGLDNGSVFVFADSDRYEVQS